MQRLQSGPFLYPLSPAPPDVLAAVTGSAARRRLAGLLGSGSPRAVHPLDADPEALSVEDSWNNGGGDDDALTGRLTGTPRQATSRSVSGAVTSGAVVSTPGRHGGAPGSARSAAGSLGTTGSVQRSPDPSALARPAGTPVATPGAQGGAQAAGHGGAPTGRPSAASDSESPSGSGNASEVNSARQTGAQKAAARTANSTAAALLALGQVEDVGLEDPAPPSEDVPEVFLTPRTELRAAQTRRAAVQELLLQRLKERKEAEAAAEEAADRRRM
jgi:hypothetical protein